MNSIRNIIDGICLTDKGLVSLAPIRIHNLPTKYEECLGVNSDISAGRLRVTLTASRSEPMQDKLLLLRSLSHYTCLYTIGWGTLLGYHRDKDIIPWDDDIDVIMPIHELRRLRKDFPDKFILYRGTYRYCNSGVSSLRVKKNESEYVPNYIDIFPIGRDVDDETKRELKKYVITTWHNFKVSTWKYRLTRLPYFFMSKEYKVRRFEEILFGHIDRPCDKEYPSFAFFLYGKSFYVGRPLLNKWSVLSDCPVLVPCDQEVIEDILSKNYKDYMTPRFKAAHRCDYIDELGNGVSNLVPIKHVTSPQREYEILTNLTMMGGKCIEFIDKFLVMVSDHNHYCILKNYLEFYYSDKIVLVHTPGMRVY